MAGKRVASLTGFGSLLYGCPMTPVKHQQIINGLRAVTTDTQRTLTRFEATGMDEEMPADYENWVSPGRMPGVFALP